MYYYRRDNAELSTTANASSAKTFGMLCGKFNAHVTSDVSDKRTRVYLVFDHYLPNFINEGKKA